MINAFSKVVLKATDLRLSKWLFTDLKAGRNLALRFVAGETLAEAVSVAKDLNALGMVVSLDLLGESVTDIGSARAARDELELFTPGGTAPAEQVGGAPGYEPGFSAGRADRGQARLQRQG